MPEPLFHIVLVGPEIPGNTGSIGRTCVALQASLILIGPLGFDLGEKAVRRAGLDYWKYLQVQQYKNFIEFFKEKRPKSMSFYSRSAPTPFYRRSYEAGCYLVFGSENKRTPRRSSRAISRFLLLSSHSFQVRPLLEFGQRRHRSCL